MVEHFLLLLITTALAASLIHRFRQPAVRIGLVDCPDARKIHAGHVPLIGGIAMFVAFAFTALLTEISLASYRPLFTGAGLLLITGTLDDLRDLGASEKLIFQLIGAGVLVFWGDLEIASLGTLPLFGDIPLGVFSIPFTLICVVGLINAINMIDGMDGLCGSVVVIILFWLVTLAWVGGVPGDLLVLPVLLAASVIGFLLFNMPHADPHEPRVFMGDSGSTMLGFLVAWFAIEIVFRGNADIPPVSVAWILALPIFDTLCLMVRRVLKGQNPMKSDREHLHHIFERAGFARSTTTYILVASSFTLGGVGVVAWCAGIPESLLWPPLLLLLGAYFMFVHHAWQAMRILRKLRAQGAPASTVSTTARSSQRYGDEAG